MSGKLLKHRRFACFRLFSCTPHSPRHPGPPSPLPLACVSRRGVVRCLFGHVTRQMGNYPVMRLSQHLGSLFKEPQRESDATECQGFPEPRRAGQETCNVTTTFTRHIRPITHLHVKCNKFQSAASCKLNSCSPHDANYSVIFQKLFRVGPPLFMRERTLSLMKTDYNSGVMEIRGDFSIPLVGLHGPQSCYPALANDHTVISLLTPLVTLAYHRDAATATGHPGPQGSQPGKGQSGGPMDHTSAEKT